MQTTDIKGYHLSLPQTRLWMQQGEGQIRYAQCAVLLNGELAIPSLLGALQTLVQRHDILRTAFRRIPGMEIPVQVVMSDLQLECPVLNLEHLSASDQRICVDERLLALQRRISTLEALPLFAVELLRLSTHKHLLLLCLPALCADEYTLKHIVWELSQMYTTPSQNEIELDEEPLQYAEVAAWQEELQQSEEAETLRAYWQKIDLSQLTSVRLPFAQQNSLRTSGPSVENDDPFALSTYELVLEESLAAQVEQLAAQYSVSVEAWLLTCWKMVLWRLNRMQNALLGIVCDGRSYEGLTEELAKALGPCTHMVPLEARLEQDVPFVQVVRSVHKSLTEAIKRQNYFSWDDVSSSDTAVTSPHQHFFPIGFEYTLWPELSSGNMTFSLSTCSCNFERTLLTLKVVQIGELDPLSINPDAINRVPTPVGGGVTPVGGGIGLRLQFQYDPNSITLVHVEQVASAFQALLHSGTAQPQAQMSMLAILETTEQASLLALSHTSTRAIPQLGLHQLFEAQVQHQPNQLAVIDLQGQLTYQQLNEQANQLAHVLRQRGVGPNVLVGLCLPRQAQMLVGLLGILKAGGAYLPLDLGSPVTRLTHQLQESNATLLLTQLAVCPQLPEWQGSILCLEELEGDLAHASRENPVAGNVGDDLAYVIYTSGSTGMPKGVMVRQSSVVNYTQALCEQVGAEPGWQFATVSTLAADLGNTAIFCALASGGCVQVLDYEMVTSGEALANWAVQHPIDVLKIVPSHLSALLESERAQAFLPRRALVLGGEALSPQLVERIRQIPSTCQIYNHYGPTEATIGVLVNPLETGEQTTEGASIALGRPIANIQVYVLDRQMQLLPEGIVGELYIGGAGLALGYLQQAAQTAERFVPHPYSEVGGKRLYRTGDLVHYGEKGKIVFVGRSDGQVKLRGYRIELREIETALRQHPLVWDCAVQLQEEGPGAPRLIGYVVARTAAGLASQELRAALREKLPEYMLPSGFVMLESLPLTANGKLDRRRLPLPELLLENEPVVQVEPRSPIEEMLVQMWKDVLQVSSIGVDDNFFALGGHSLLATRVMARLQAMFQVVLSVQMLFEAPTVAELTQRIEQALRADEGIAMPPLVAGVRPDEIPLSFAQQRLWFLDQLEPDSIAYLAPRALRFSGDLHAEALEQSLETLIQKHESLRTTFEERAGRPVQIIHPASSFTLPIIDLQGLPLEQREKATQHLVSQEALHPYDLTKGPMLRAYLLRLSEPEHVILFTLHHIVTDRWSIQILVRELTALYQMHSTGQASLPAPLSPSLPIQYADYAIWQRQWLQGEVLEHLVHYWQDQLQAPLPVLNLPTDYPRASLQTSKGAARFFRLPTSLSEGLNALGQQEGATLFMTLLAAFTALLHYYTEQDDLVVGTDIANRNQVETENLIGFFVNQLVLRTDLAGDPSFLEIVRRVRNVALKAYTYQDLPFDRLVDALHPARDLSRTPLFQVKFVLQNVPRQQLSLNDITMEMIEFEREISKFDLLLNMEENGHELAGWLDYRTDLFKPETITQFIQQFEAIIRHVVAFPETPLHELEAILAAADGIVRETQQQELRQTGLQKLKQTKRKSKNVN